MVSLDAIREKRDQIVRLAEKHKASNVRVFGSFVRNEADDRSDLDLLVRMAPEASLLDRIALIRELENLLGRKVDVVNDKALHWTLRDRILNEGVPL